MCGTIPVAEIECLLCGIRSWSAMFSHVAIQPKTRFGNAEFAVRNEMQLVRARFSYGCMLVNLHLIPRHKVKSLPNQCHCCDDRRLETGAKDSCLPPELSECSRSRAQGM